MGIAVTDKHLREAADDILSLPKRSLTLVEKQPSQVEILDDLFEHQSAPVEPGPLPASNLRRAEVIARSFDPSALNEGPTVETSSYEEEECHVSVEAMEDVASMEGDGERYDTAEGIHGEEVYAEEVHAEEVHAEEVYERGYAPQLETVPPPRTDGYAVGLRLLRISPIWLLLVSVAFFLVIFAMSWMSQPSGHAEVESPAPAKTNHATNTATAGIEAAPAESASEAEEARAETPVEASEPAKAEAPVTAEETTANSSSSVQKKPETAPEKSATVAETETGGAARFTVQVASFESESDANERVSKLRAAGFEARTVAVELPKRGTWYRVHVGSFAGREEAARTVGKLKSAGVATDAFVTGAQSR